jgi:hypothetical protein
VTKKIHCPQGYRAIKAIMPSRLSCHKGYRIFHVTLTRVEEASIRSKHQTNDASKVKEIPQKMFTVERQEHLMTPTTMTFHSFSCNEAPHAPRMTSTVCLETEGSIKGQVPKFCRPLKTKKRIKKSKNQTKNKFYKQEST